MLHWGYVNLSIPIVYYSADGKGGTHPYLRFRTIANSSLLWLYQSFYVNGTKVVPLNIIEFMNPRVLATWIADDGGMSGSGLLLHCNSYTHTDVLRLAACLHTCFGIVRVKYNNTILYIPASYMPLLRSIVLPYLHPAFYYKVGNRSVNSI